MVEKQGAQGDSNGDSKGGSGVELSPVTVARLETFHVAAGQGLVRVDVRPNEFNPYGQTVVSVVDRRVEPVVELELDVAPEEVGRTAKAQVLKALRVEGEGKACRMIAAYIREAGKTFRAMPSGSICLEGGELEGRDHNRPSPEQITLADEVHLWFQYLDKGQEGQSLFTRVFGQTRSFRWMEKNLEPKKTQEGWRKRFFRVTCEPILCALQN